jgi:hypothetical protein
MQQSRDNRDNTPHLATGITFSCMHDKATAAWSNCLDA